MSGKKFRVVCYCRVATKNQNDDSPLEAQSVYLRRYAKDNGLGGHLIIVMDQTVSQCVIPGFFLTH